MTSASELFYNRRHRLGRTALDLGLQSPPAPDLHRLHHHRLQVADSASDYSLRRHNHLLRLRHRWRSEHALGRLDQRHRRSLLDDVDESTENVRDIRGLRESLNDRLPAGVLHARARLLERLRGDPVSRNRRNDRYSMDTDQESELSSDVFAGGSLVADLTYQMGRSHLSQELNKRPPGLTQEALNCLQVEVFSSRETALDSRVLQDCGICLESFTDGDELIHLPCGHRFHSACLNPWIRCCGDCPYCRSSIDVNSHVSQSEAE